MAKGNENVKNLLNELNNKKVDNRLIDEIQYYYLYTPIEFFDVNIDDKKRKSEIEFIDLPGINNKQYEKDFLMNIINFTDFFLFINDKNVIDDVNKELIEEFFARLINEKFSFDLNSIMFVVNQIDLMGEIKNQRDIDNVIKDFSDETNKIFKKIVSNEWNYYIKLFKICSKNQKFLFSYFSSKTYIENKKEEKEINELFKHCRVLIKYLIEKYYLKDADFETKIKGIIRFMEKNYFTRLSNKDNFSFDKSNYIDSDLQEICDELKNFGAQEEQITNNISEIKKIAKIYNFTKNKR